MVKIEVSRETTDEKINKQVERAAFDYSIDATAIKRIILALDIMKEGG